MGDTSASPVRIRRAAFGFLGPNGNPRLDNFLTIFRGVVGHDRRLQLLPSPLSTTRWCGRGGRRH
ncbi:hypothetical protein J6590_064310 [Homalodisca vitripennis]|nr:hypothetical protein J6590_064310 [Homalodisca vitripennis]